MEQSIGVSVLRGDTATAGSIMFLLGIGELLEEWTHKKSVDDLARTMSLNVDKVWIKEASGQEVLVSASRIRENDQIVVHMGNVVPFDGTVSDGEAMLNQASLTGESAPVRKTDREYGICRNRRRRRRDHRFLSAKQADQAGMRRSQHDRRV